MYITNIYVYHQSSDKSCPSYSRLMVSVPWSHRWSFTKQIQRAKELESGPDLLLGADNSNYQELSFFFFKTDHLSQIVPMCNFVKIFQKIEKFWFRYEYHGQRMVRRCYAFQQGQITHKSWPKVVFQFMTHRLIEMSPKTISLWKYFKGLRKSLWTSSFRGR